MFQIVGSSNNSYDVIHGLTIFIILFETSFKIFFLNISLEFIYNIVNNLLLTIILCGLYYITDLLIFLEIYTHIFIYTNTYKLLFSNNKIESLLNIFSIYFLNEQIHIFFLSNFGYTFLYLRELKKYSGMIEEEYYIYHQLYLFLFRFIPLCYLFFNGQLYTIIYIILISLKIIYI